MALKPWYKLVTPREDLREGKPLDASEFAVNLDHVRHGTAPDDYKDPHRFFERTFLTGTLKYLGTQTIKRLSGIQTETNAIFDLTTNFGGGKTHALTMLYHLAHGGPSASNWKGIKSLLDESGVRSVPKANVAVFVGTEFDSIKGRGGDDGTPLRKTPWGEIAFQLGGPEAFAHVKEHEESLTAPAGDVIRAFMPKDKPCLILIDELMNYVTRNRKNGLSSQLYTFIQNLSEFSRSQANIVLAVSIPASEMTEMSDDDHSDYTRFKKLLERLGRPVTMSTENETAEIIRRRLFEWGGLSLDASSVCSDYADWVLAHRNQLPDWFPVDSALAEFKATYPFHPSVFSVFERKWQTLPRFQQTRGILRLLALWVSNAYREGFKKNHKDPLISLGSAPLDDQIFRAAICEQLNENRLDATIRTDICGDNKSFAVKLDAEATDEIKKRRLHRKIATTIFFESNGGQEKDHAYTTLPEIRLAVSEPDLDIGNIESVLDSLRTNCHYLSPSPTGSGYRFGVKPNLIKVLSDRLANIPSASIDERMKSEIQKIFNKGNGTLKKYYFPSKTTDVPDQPALTLVVLSAEYPISDRDRVLQFIEAVTKECGTSARTYKSALIWTCCDDSSLMREEVRKILAWETIQTEEEHSKFDDSERNELKKNLAKSKMDLEEAIWRSYKILVLLNKSNGLDVIDLGLTHSSAASSLIALFVNYLENKDIISRSISPNTLANNWAPAFKEWSTRSIRDAFYASPLFPRLINQEALKETISKGVSNQFFAYVGKSPNDEYNPFIFGEFLNVSDIEISDEFFIISKKDALEYKTNITKPEQEEESPVILLPSEEPTLSPIIIDSPVDPEPVVKTSKIKKLRWTGEVPPRKWQNFYMKVLSKYATNDNGLKLNIDVEVAPEHGISEQVISETKIALRELGLDDSCLEVE